MVGLLLTGSIQKNILKTKNLLRKINWGYGKELLLNQKNGENFTGETYYGFYFQKQMCMR